MVAFEQIKLCTLYNCITFALLKNTVRYDYTIHNEMLNRVDQVTDLGVLIDNRLLFANHIRLLAQKAYRSLGYITRFSQGFACDVFVVLYCTFVRSTIEYASQVWSPQSLTHIATIEDVQKKFLRTCSFRMKVPLVDGHTNYNLILSRLNLTSLESRRSVNDLSFLYKLLRGDVDCSFLLGRLNFRIGHRTRSTDLFYPEYHRTDYGLHSPIVRMQNNFNRFNLPAHNISSYSSFKKIVKGVCK